MKGSEKCSRKGTVKLTLVTSNLHMTRKVPSGLRQGTVRLSPVDEDGDCSEDPRQPGARDGPGEEVEAGQEHALQAEHSVRVEEDRAQAEGVYFV